MFLRKLRKGDRFCGRDFTTDAEMVMADFFWLTTNDGVEIKVWRPAMVYMPHNFMDCSGFAMNTFPRFGYSIVLASLQKLLDKNYVKFFTCGDVQISDLVVFYSLKEKDEKKEVSYDGVTASGEIAQEYKPVHVARVFKPHNDMNKLQVIHKKGYAEAGIESLERVVKFYEWLSEKKIEIAFYRELNPEDRIDVFDLIAMSAQPLGKYFREPDTLDRLQHEKRHAKRDDKCIVS